MKNMQRLFGIIALVAVIGFYFIACDNGTGGDDGGDPADTGTSVPGVRQRR